MRASAVVRFGYRLCLAMHDPNLLRRLSTRDFQQWMLYEQVEPFGELRADFRSAQVVAMIHNVAVAQKDQKPVGDFLLKFEEKKEQRQSVEEQAMILNIIAAALAAGG